MKQKKMEVVTEKRKSRGSVWLTEGRKVSEYGRHERKLMKGRKKWKED